MEGRYAVTKGQVLVPPCFRFLQKKPSLMLLCNWAVLFTRLASAIPDWDWLPYYTKGSNKSTNCVKATSTALRSGGIPLDTSRYWWPGGLADDLTNLSKSNAPNQAWKVTVVSTQNGSHQ